MSINKLIVCLICVYTLLISLGCSQASIHPSIKNIAKNELDRTADQSINIIKDYLIEMTLELYRLNPEELNKIKGMNLQVRTTQIIEFPTSVAYKELNHAQSTEAIKIALSENYRGDRVFALMIGISSMIEASYNNQKEFYFVDHIDPQKLYNSSANLHLVANKLGDNKYHSLIVTSTPESPLKVYALLQKTSAIQKLIATIVSEKTGRILDKAISGATIFLPI